MMLEVLFDEESINSKFGITLAERPVLPVSQPRYTSYDVPGRNGKLTVFDGYDDVPYSLRFNYIDENAKPTFREIVNFLTGKTKVRLSDSDRYRVISQSIINVNNANNDIAEWCDFEIEIITEPFEYEDEETSVFDGSGIIINPSKIDAPIIINVYGDGDCNVRVNENQIQLTGVQGHVTIDGILKNAYRGNMTQNNNMSGNYPSLSYWENEVAISGNTKYIEIKKRWCWR